MNVLPWNRIRLSDIYRTVVYCDTHSQCGLPSTVEKEKLSTPKLNCNISKASFYCILKSPYMNVLFSRNKCFKKKVIFFCHYVYLHSWTGLLSTIVFTRNYDTKTFYILVFLSKEWYTVQILILIHDFTIGTHQRIGIIHTTRVWKWVTTVF